MRALGRRGGERSAEIRAAARRSLAARLAERLQDEADKALQAVTSALVRGEVDQAFEILDAVSQDRHLPAGVERERRLREWAEFRRWQREREAEKERKQAARGEDEMRAAARSRYWASREQELWESRFV
jgi:hypothetical protein